jgi:hypothetical protein
MLFKSKPVGFLHLTHTDFNPVVQYIDQTSTLGLYIPCDNIYSNTKIVTQRDLITVPDGIGTRSLEDFNEKYR